MSKIQTFIYIYIYNSDISNFSTSIFIIKMNSKNLKLILFTLNIYIVIYEALCFDVAQGRMNGTPNETRTHSCRFASQAC